MNIKFKYNDKITDGFGDEKLGIPALSNRRFFKHGNRTMVSGSLKLKAGDVITWLNPNAKMRVPHDGSYNLSFFEVEQ